MQYAPSQGGYCHIPSSCVLEGLRAISNIHSYYTIAFYVAGLTYVIVDAVIPILPWKVPDKHKGMLLYLKSTAAFIIVVWCLLLIVG